MTLKFCRVCGFRVRVWGSYRTSRSFGYGYGSVTELTEVPGIVAQAYRTHRSSRRVQKTCCTRTRGIVARVLQNSQKFRVRVWGSYRTSRTSGYGYGSLTKRPELPGTGVQNFQKVRVGINMLHGYPGSLWHRRTELPKVLCSVWLCVYPTDRTKIGRSGRTKIGRSGTGVNVVQNSQPFRVRVGLYRTHRSPGYG